MTPRIRQTHAKSNRMNATQLLLFQSNLYSQTDLQPKPILRERTNGLRSGSANIVREDLTCSSSTNQGNKKSTQTRKPRNLKKTKNFQSSNIASCLNSEKEGSSEIKSMDLNWQQASLLKSKRHCKGSDVPSWAVQQPNNSTKQICSSLPSVRKTKKKNDKTSQLPPLRFSSAPGKSAWRFVLPTPNLSRSSDLPTWYDSEKDDLVVTLGSCRDTPSSFLESGKQEYVSEGDSSVSSESSSSLTSSSSIDALSEGTLGDTSSHDLVNSMIKSFTIYAGPSFSAAAPQACHLPVPSFLTRC